MGRLARRARAEGSWSPGLTVKRWPKTILLVRIGDRILDCYEDNIKHCRDIYEHRVYILVPLKPKKRKVKR